MSFENRRLDRITRIIELLQCNPEGLTAQTIAKDTKILREITKDRLLMYLRELQWDGTIFFHRATAKYRLRK